MSILIILISKNSKSTSSNEIFDGAYKKHDHKQLDKYFLESISNFNVTTNYILTLDKQTDTNITRSQNKQIVLVNFKFRDKNTFFLLFPHRLLTNFLNYASETQSFYEWAACLYSLYAS